jgi:hypothetical protein
MAFAISGSAQPLGSPTTASQTDPAHPSAPAAPLRYHSALDGYRAFEDKGVGNWREVNDRVRDAAAKRAQTAHGSATGHPTQPPPPLPSTKAPHGGHGRQGATP